MYENSTWEVYVELFMLSVIKINWECIDNILNNTRGVFLTCVYLRINRKSVSV